MRRRIVWAIGLTMAFYASAILAEAHSIPAEKVDDQKIFWGSAANFSKPGQVDYEAIVRATPEYESIKSKKIQAGTAKYWILLSKASDHAVRLIREAGQESEYDLIVASGYLNSLEQPIAADDLTKVVLDRLAKK